MTRFHVQPHDNIYQVVDSVNGLVWDSSPSRVVADLYCEFANNIHRDATPRCINGHMLTSRGDCTVCERQSDGTH